MSNAPEKKYKAGRLQVVVWNNPNMGIGIQLTKNYQDQKTTEYKTTHSINERELGDAILLLQEAQRDYRLSVDGVRSNDGDDIPV